jgi:hypothetical protein
VIPEAPVQVRLPNPHQSPNTNRAQVVLAHAPEGGPADAEHLAILGFALQLNLEVFNLFIELH